jgi:hypothetical protein
MAIMLAACGGGGGGGGGGANVPTAPIIITGANAEAVASDVYVASTGVVDSGGMVMAAQTTSAAPPKPLLGRVTAKVAALIEQYETSSQSQTVVGAVTTYPCAVSGSYSIDDNGSSVALTFSTCSDSTGEWINGSISVTNIAGNVDWSDWTATVNMNMTVHIEGFPDTSLSGSYNFHFVEDPNTLAFAITMSGSSLTMNEGSETAVLSNFNLTFSDDAFLAYSGTFTLASTGLGGSVAVTMTGFQQYYYNDYPHAGVMTVTGEGSGLRLTVIDATQVTLDVDVDGDDVYDTSTNMFWTDFGV